MALSLLGISIVGLVGCQGLRDPNYDNKHHTGEVDTGGPADTDTDTDTDSDTDTETGDTDTGEDTDTQTETGDSEDSGDEGFDEPGDHVDFDAEDGVAIDLADASGDSNKDQDFYLITVNTGNSAVSYDLRYGESASGPPSPQGKGGWPFVNPGKPGRMAPPHATPDRREVLTDADIGIAQDSFIVRTDLRDDEEFQTQGATLWALGDNVEIWVDTDVPIDWDYECDGIVDVPFWDERRDTFGFDNCDLATVADIIDLNVVPNVRSLFGDESDIDGDGRIAVFITPLLNTITQTSEDPAVQANVLPSYTEPTVDLTPADALTNPGSDEREVVYTFAPDPAGYYNPDALVDIDQYTQYSVAAEFARGMTALVSYNQHVIVWEDDGDESTSGTVEDDWANDALGTFAADYCGFGAAYYRTAWDYLDAPYLYPLLASNTNGTLERLDYGAQYLFALWLYDWANATGLDPIEVFNAMVQTTDTGPAAIEGATGESFNSLVLAWQVALLTTGVESSGSALVDDGSLYVPYADITTISSPPAAHDNHYGANGYQAGFNPRGDNQPRTGGTTDDPQDEAEARIHTTGSDFFMYNQEFDYHGYIAEDYAAQVTRLTGMPFDTTTVVVDPTGDGVIGEIVRWTDPTSTDWAVENVFSPTETQAVDLPPLPSDGSQLHALGALTTPTTIEVMYADTTSATADVTDTDLWHLDLTDRTVGEQVEVTVWLDRQFANDSGGSGPPAPWIAIAPMDYVPQPTSIVTFRKDTSCDGGIVFEYPLSILDYLYAQEVLSPTMYEATSDGYYGCGSGSGAGSLTCSEDWDDDGVADSEEPTPANLYEQIRAGECAYWDNSIPEDVERYHIGWMDADELDDDDEEDDPEPSLGYLDGAGGRAGVSGEEGYVRVTLTGGEEYFIIVGDSAGGEGAYELSIMQMN